MNLTRLQQKIFEVRGKKVMLDFDLAILYSTKTKILNQAVKRNPSRFPADFMFRLTKKEWNELVTICDQLPENLKHSKLTPVAFTEHGVTMLASVLKSSRASRMNVLIVRAFIAMKAMLAEYKELQHKITELEKKYNKQFSSVYEALHFLMTEKSKQKSWDQRERIGFRK